MKQFCSKKKEKKQLLWDCSNLWSKNWYKRSTSLSLGGSESGTVFLSFKILEETFSWFPNAFPAGSEIRYDVCTNLTAEPWKETTLLPLLNGIQFLLLNWTESTKTRSRTVLQNQGISIIRKSHLRQMNVRQFCDKRTKKITQSNSIRNNNPLAFHYISKNPSCSS